MLATDRIELSIAKDLGEKAQLRSKNSLESDSVYRGRTREALSKIHSVTGKASIGCSGQGNQPTRVGWQVHPAAGAAWWPE